MPRTPRPRRAGRARAPARGAPAGEDAGPERAQKVLARAGLGSRREAEAWIRAGRVTVNGIVATLGTRVSASDQLQLDGRRVRDRARAGTAAVYLCHRSPGEPLAASQAVPDEMVRSALSERLPRRLGRRLIAVSPMPRIDGGLELVTSDGALAASLQRGVHALVSRFGVRVHGELGAPQLQRILDGVLDSGARLAVEDCQAAGGTGANRWYTLQVRGASGKEVRQLFERQGARVSRVLRTQLGPVALERSLGRGRARALTDEELGVLLAGGSAAADVTPAGQATRQEPERRRPGR